MGGLEVPMGSSLSHDVSLGLKKAQFLRTEDQSHDCLLLISGGLDLQCLGAGPGFPARDWAGWRWRKQQILATRPVFSDKGPGPLALQKRISTKKLKVVEQVKSFLGGKRVRMGRHKGRLREGVVPSWRFR